METEVRPNGKVEGARMENRLSLSPKAVYYESSEWLQTNKTTWMLAKNTRKVLSLLKSVDCPRTKEQRFLKT